MSGISEHRGRNEVPASRATKILTLNDLAASGADLVLDREVLDNLHRLEIPVVPNLDAEILRHIKADPWSFWMGTWHFEASDRCPHQGRTCGTTHCRAGWAIVLAGAEGKKLEDEFGPDAAGTLIYAASRPGEEIPDFYTGEGKAIEDIRACAARQLAGASS